MNPEKPKTWNRITAEDRKMSQIDFERTNLPSGETSNLPLVCSPDLVFQGTFMLFPEERLLQKGTSVCGYLSSCRKQRSVDEPGCQQ